MHDVKFLYVDSDLFYVEWDMKPYLNNLAPVSLNLLVYSCSGHDRAYLPLTYL